MSPASLSSLLDIPFSSNMTACYLTDPTGSLLWAWSSSLPQGGQPSALPSPPPLSKLLHGGLSPAQSSPVTTGLPLGRPDRMVQDIVTWG